MAVRGDVDDGRMYMFQCYEYSSLLLVVQSLTSSATDDKLCVFLVLEEYQFVTLVWDNSVVPARLRR